MAMATSCSAVDPVMAMVTKPMRPAMIPSTNAPTKRVMRSVSIAPVLVADESGFLGSGELVSSGFGAEGGVSSKVVTGGAAGVDLFRLGFGMDFLGSLMGLGKHIVSGVVESGSLEMV